MSPCFWDKRSHFIVAGLKDLTHDHPSSRIFQKGFCLLIKHSSSAQFSPFRELGPLKR